VPSRTRAFASPPRAEAGTAVAVALALFAALLLLAPPASNWVWAVDGFRSVPLGSRVGLLAAAAALWLVARVRSDSRWAWIALSIPLALVICFPLAESGQFLGDTGFRIRSIAAFSTHRFGQSFQEWSSHLRAQPLDIAVNFLGTIAWQQLGLPVIRAVQANSLVLALVFFAVVWRSAARLEPPAGSRLLVCLVIALSGALEAFAGYAESSGLTLIAGAWWWAEMLAPLERRRRVLRLTVAWMVLFLAHRQALALIPAMVVRGLWPAHAKDETPARRELLWGSALAVAAAIGLTWAMGERRHLGDDAADFGAVLMAWARGRRIPAPSDVLNLGLLLAPLGIVALAIRGERRGAPAASPRWVYVTAAIGLTPLLVTILVGPHELGAHRDWDTAELLGWTGTLAALGAILRLPAARAREVLVQCVPVLALLAGSWLAVNAHLPAVYARAEALASQPPRLVDEQLSALEVYLGEQEMNRFRAAPAAPHFERAYELAPNPRLLLLAAEARARAGEFARARADIDRARKSGALTPRNEESARVLERLVDDLERSPTPATGAP
jgi:hypothetical protein